MRGIAELSYSVIRYIEEKNISRDGGLGHYKPLTRYLSDLGNIDTDLPDEEWERFEESYQKHTAYFASIAPPSC
jgi:hypothetical protein